MRSRTRLAAPTPTGPLERRLKGLLPPGTADILGRATSDLKANLDAGRAVVVLDGEPESARVIFEAAGSSGVSHVVLVSSALVYGAWANNPVPLSEEAPLRPNPELDWAVGAAQVERLAADWRDDHPGSTVAVLRPATAVAEDVLSWLARGLHAARRLRAGEGDPPGQYVHLDDVASAVTAAVTERLDGVFNVAPDGWIAGEALRALAGGPRIHVPDRVASRLASLRWRLGWADAPPGLLPYGMHPWVVANDRLKATGWRPTQTNEEAFVAGHRAGPLATLSPSRRQQLSLGVAGVVLSGGIGGVVALVRRRLRNRRPA